MALPLGSSQHRIATSPAASCTLCYKEARKVCSCGEARCEQCLRLGGVSFLHTVLEVHPAHRPATCYVADLQMDDDIKLEWLAQELGDEANLTDFAKKLK